MKTIGSKSIPLLIAGGGGGVYGAEINGFGGRKEQFGGKGGNMKSGPDAPKSGGNRLGGKGYRGGGWGGGGIEGDGATNKHCHPAKAYVHGATGGLAKAWGVPKVALGWRCCICCWWWRRVFEVVMEECI
eukprot:TRINITY_DN13496_c0_g1_i1.p1 TRINITY_DN13496_c0_g1~~TRINITY_DN13496_c0_g1_i1.p1  ORF type:complete len:130 (-),score=30.85 TRINITY_DN13496_c0_g1_i1:144-533(-)